MTSWPGGFVSQLRMYPVKSLRGHDIQATEVEAWGFAGDRRWLVVDANGGFLTQRQFARMTQISALQDSAGLLLETPSLGPISVPVPLLGAEQIEVTIWRDKVPAALADSRAGEWLSEALGTTCRLAYLADPRARPVDPAYADAGDRVSFADGFPVLLASEASLDDLNTHLEHPISIRRFRPNIVISGSEGWAEDTWRRVQIGEAIFRVAKPCARCVVTTIDQESGEKPVPDEPLRTLATFRRARGGVMFGQNLVPEKLGRVALGDPVTVLEAGPSNLLRAG